MKVGIDISQLAFNGTGVATYLQNLVENLILHDTGNEYVLFYSSLRKEFQISNFKFQINSKNSNVVLKKFKLPPTFLNILWNKLHIFPIEWFIGPVDVFISSDWTQPPSRAKKVTILYDMIVYTYPQETDAKIVSVQKARLEWVKKEVERIICISEASKRDAMEILGIPEKRLSVVYPGV
jgi:glycosyltransferase involved in cell wall biosynthesis